MRDNKKIISFLFTSFVVWFVVSSNSSCGIYKFADVSIDPDIKTVKVNYIENRASYINPQLSPQLTDKLRQKIVNQTKLTQVSNDNPHLEISGEVRQYLVTTSAISDQKVASNRLSITVHIIVLNRLKDEPPKEYDVSRSFDFAANLTLAQAEARLNEEIIRNLVDETFNRIFSEW